MPTATCLIIEDEPAIRRLIAIVLEDAGCRALVAPDAETALRLLDTQVPDVIIADVRLPGMDGVELASHVKASEALSATPVLLMSAYGEPAQHSADAFLPKPFDADGLIEAVIPFLEGEWRAR